MASVLRVDTPPRLRRLDTVFETGRFEGLFVVTCMFGCLAGLGFIMFASAGYRYGTLLTLVWLAVCCAFITWSVGMMLRIRRWRTPVRIGPHWIRAAHNLYWDLTPETRATYGLPLILAMYRLTMTPVLGGEAVEAVEGQMWERVDALKRLLAVEDEIRLAVADPSMSDRDDVVAAGMFAAAIAPVASDLDAT
jgi:hypothetical protein